MDRKELWKTIKDYEIGIVFVWIAPQKNTCITIACLHLIEVCVEEIQLINFKKVFFSGNLVFL